MYAKDIDPKCAYCIHGTPLAINELEVICDLRGIVAYNHTCRKFKYDVFKKKVKRKSRSEDRFTPEDFSID